VRKKIVVGNWKMNLLRRDGLALTQALLPLVEAQTEVEIGLAPNFLSIPAIVAATENTEIGVSAQNVFWKESGAFTSFISPAFLVDAGVKYVIIGHSETRGRFGKLEVLESTIGFFAETDETVNLKIKAILPHGLIPILCVGENLSEREAQQTDAVIRSQIDGALAGLTAEDVATLVVAYEPVWAIGTGQTCDTPEAERVCGLIRNHLGHLFGAVSDAIRIQYGGSVKASNAAELFAQPNIDGGLVGGASLNAEEFAAIIKAAA
jgi:triosephosphate isomerase